MLFRKFLLSSCVSQLQDLMFLLKTWIRSQKTILFFFSLCELLLKMNGFGYFRNLSQCLFYIKYFQKTITFI